MLSYYMHLYYLVLLSLSIISNATKNNNNNKIILLRFGFCVVIAGYIFLHKMLYILYIYINTTREGEEEENKNETYIRIHFCCNYTTILYVIISCMHTEI
jgi:hypothetical protein